MNWLGLHRVIWKPTAQLGLIGSWIFKACEVIFKLSFIDRDGLGDKLGPMSQDQLEIHIEL